MTGGTNSLLIGQTIFMTLWLPWVATSTEAGDQPKCVAVQDMNRIAIFDSEGLKE
jgi:hypothetical protein